MAQTTLRNGIVDLLNELQKVIDVCRDPIQFNTLTYEYAQLIEQLQGVIKTDMSTAFKSKEYREAIKELNESTSIAKEAVTEVKKTGEVIQKIAKALGKITEVFVFLVTIGVGGGK